MSRPSPGGTGYRLPSGPKLNLGCGPIQPAGWINIDGSHRAWLASRLPRIDHLMTRLGVLPPTEFGPATTFRNLYKPLPFADNSVSGIYAGELWEHFVYSDALALTAECHRVLAPGGVLRVRVPDGPTFWRNYLELFDRVKQMPKADRSVQVLIDRIDLYFREICTERRLLRSMGHTHKWQFDELQLIDMFESEGFVCVERMAYHDSRIHDVALVEHKDLLIVEGMKPAPGEDARQPATRTSNVRGQRSHHVPG